MTLKACHQGRQAAGVLGANPVEFEAVGHKQSDALLIVRDPSGQRFDPGVELLFGQFASELVDAGLPQRLACIHLKFWGNSLGHVLLFLWTVGILNGGTA